MFPTVEAVIDDQGVVRLIEPIRLPAGRKVLVTILDDIAPSGPEEITLLSQAALSDWDRPEEDEAWAHFQQAP